jgi:AraC family transcriptional regulator of arabinose operon
VVVAMGMCNEVLSSGSGQGRGGACSAHLYSIPNGFLYAATQVFGGPTKRHPWVLLLSLSGKPLVLRVRGEQVICAAALIAPRVEGARARARGGLASLNVEPGHPAYNALPQLGESGCCALPGQAFGDLLPAFQRCLLGTASPAEVLAAFEAAIETALSIMPRCRRERDSRIAAVINVLQGRSPIDYCFSDVQDKARLSAGRLSHVFTDQAGLSIRSFLLWRKTKEALSLLADNASATRAAHEAGFSDSAHLTRTLQQTIGLLPSMLGPSRQVQVHDLVRA